MMQKIHACLWLFLCIVVILVSIFIHECGHGLACAMNGQEVSTGFNRVGNLYKYPGDPDFRKDLDLSKNSLKDFGVPATLLLAAIFTFISCRTNKKRLLIVSLSFGACNSLMRLLPCLWVVLYPVITGKIHIEDEYETGVVLNALLHSNYFTYIPALFSIAVSVICLFFLFRRLKEKMSIVKILFYLLDTYFAYFIAIIIANGLDSMFRINWHAF